MATEYYLDIDGSNRSYIKTEHQNYMFITNKVYTGERIFAAFAVTGDNKGLSGIKGSIEFNVLELGEKDIFFQLWFAPDKELQNVYEVNFQTNILKALGINKIITKAHKNGAPTHQSGYSRFFSLLDNLGESWNRWNYDPVKKPPTKLTLVEDYFHKKCNLKGKIILGMEKGSFQKRTEEGTKGEEYVYCKFEEDIGGSNLDGKSSKRDYLFLPKRLVVPVGTEVKQKKNKDEVLEVTQEM